MQPKIEVHRIAVGLQIKLLNIVVIDTDDYLIRFCWNVVGSGFGGRQKSCRTQFEGPWRW